MNIARNNKFKHNGHKYSIMRLGPLGEWTPLAPLFEQMEKCAAEGAWEMLKFGIENKGQYRLVGRNSEEWSWVEECTKTKGSEIASNEYEVIPAEVLPPSEEPVLVVYQRYGTTIVKGAYIGKHCVEATDELDESEGDYNEKDDVWYMKEGWYEICEAESLYVPCEGKVISWTQLPKIRT